MKTSGTRGGPRKNIIGKDSGTCQPTKSQKRTPLLVVIREVMIITSMLSVIIINILICGELERNRSLYSISALFKNMAVVIMRTAEMVIVNCHSGTEGKISDSLNSTTIKLFLV